MSILPAGEGRRTGRRWSFRISQGLEAKPMDARNIRMPNLHGPQENTFF
jgi:hypothetical protein